MNKVLVLNGPNLNTPGTREPGIYGAATLADVERMCHDEGARLGVEVDFRQSNHEGQLIDWIHEAGAEVEAGRMVGAVFNSPAAHGIVVGFGIAGCPLAIKGLLDVVRPPAPDTAPGAAPDRAEAVSGVTKS
jgi:3-dehydroquinate dehydratase